MNMNSENIWNYMVHILSGHKYEPIVAESIANAFVSSNGTIIKHRQHNKLSEKLYTPTSLEKFIAK